MSDKTVFVIGDIQGCLAPLKALLAEIQFDPNHMQLWFAGDLINRGPDSLESLRFVKSLPSDTVSVLGNHDLSLLVDDAKNTELPEDHPLAPILKAPDRADLIEWLKHRPLLHHDPKRDYTLTHAGIYPYWDLPTAQQLAREVEQLLRTNRANALLNDLFGDNPNFWDDTLQGMDRLRFIVNAFTRMRFCTKNGGLDLKAKGAPSDHPTLTPWFDMPNRPMAAQNIVFGHWAALEAKTKCRTSHIYPLDTGCVWGNCLTAFCLETKQYISVKCPPNPKPLDTKRL